MPEMKKTFVAGMPLGIVAVVLFLILAWMNITAIGLIAGFIALVMVLITAGAVSIVMALVTTQKEKLFVYVPLVFVILIVGQMVLIGLKMLLPNIFV